MQNNKSLPKTVKYPSKRADSRGTYFIEEKDWLLTRVRRVRILLSHRSGSVPTNQRGFTVQLYLNIQLMTQSSEVYPTRG
jgi:hypothetical protein